VDRLARAFADRFHDGVSPAAEPAPARVDELLRRGRAAMAERRYAEARDLFDEALREAPDDPRVQALAVTAEFWRRLAREGDGFDPPTGPPANARRPAPGT